MCLAYVVVEEISERVTADMEGRTEANNTIFNKLKINCFRVCHITVFFLNTWKHWRMLAQEESLQLRGLNCKRDLREIRVQSMAEE